VFHFFGCSFEVLLEGAVELFEYGDPVEMLVLDAVELLFHVAGERDVHYLWEELGEFVCDDLADVGGVRQGQGQAQLSDLVNRWNFAQNQPQNQLNAFMGNVGGGYGGTTSSTVPYYSNMGAGILGGAATGAGIGSMFGANDFSSMLPYILAGGGLGGFG